MPPRVSERRSPCWTRASAGPIGEPTSSIGFVEDHGRQKTREKTVGLEVVPRRSVEYRGVAFEEMDLDAVLNRRPAVVLVDELAHTNVPGVATRSDGRTSTCSWTPASM